MGSLYPEFTSSTYTYRRISGRKMIGKGSSCTQPIDNFVSYRQYGIVCAPETMNWSLPLDIARNRTLNAWKRHTVLENSNFIIISKASIILTPPLPAPNPARARVHDGNWVMNMNRMRKQLNRQLFDGQKIGRLSNGERGREPNEIQDKCAQWKLDR